MKRILIDRQIGSDFFSDGITADFVRSELESAGDEEIELVINSPGGYVWEGIAIFNTIRDFCRKNPQAHVHTYIQGLAASCASVIALAAKCVDRKNTVSVENNSVFMIHHASTVIEGNEKQLRAAADRLAKTDAVVIISAYLSATGKSEKEIVAAMDAETYYYGQEIVDAGFADEVISDGKDSSENGRDAAVLSARSAWENCQKAMGQAKDIAGERIAAMAIQEGTDGLPSVQNKKAGAANAAGENEMEVCMTAEEFKAAHPEEAKKLLAEGAEQERRRCVAHLKMGETAGNLAVSAKFIRSGAAVADEDVQTEYFEQRVKNAVLKEREQDNVPAIQTPADDKDAGMKEALAAFDRVTGRC